MLGGNASNQYTMIGGNHKMLGGNAWKCSFLFFYPNRQSAGKVSDPLSDFFVWHETRICVGLLGKIPNKGFVNRLIKMM